jgi:hypothetical protein
MQPYPHLMKLFPIVLPLTVLFVAHSAPAAWQLMNDFEGENDLQAIEVQTPLTPNSTAWTLFQLEDPVDPSNKAMYLESGDYGITFADTHAILTLPGAGIDIGYSGTLYFRILEDGNNNNWHVSLSDENVGVVWQRLVNTMRGSEPGPVQIHSASVYLHAVPQLVLERARWYQFWMAVDTLTSTYEVFVQGPDDTQPRALTLATQDATSIARFRRVPATALKYMIISTNSGSPITPNEGNLFYFDDIYFSAGKNLSNPLTSGGSPQPQPILEFLAEKYNSLQAVGDAQGWYFSPALGTVWVDASGWFWWPEFGQQPGTSGWFFANTYPGDHTVFTAYSEYHQSWTAFDTGAYGLAFPRASGQPASGAWYYVYAPASGTQAWRQIP